MDGDMTTAEFRERIAQARRRMLDAYREMHEDMEMVISRVPTIGEDPAYVEQRAEIDAMMLGLLDEEAAIIAVLTEEEGK